MGAGYVHAELVGGQDRAGLYAPPVLCVLRELRFCALPAHDGQPQRRSTGSHLFGTVSPACAGATPPYAQQCSTLRDACVTAGGDWRVCAQCKRNPRKRAALQTTVTPMLVRDLLGLSPVEAQVLVGPDGQFWPRAPPLCPSSSCPPLPDPTLRNSRSAQRALRLAAPSRLLPAARTHSAYSGHVASGRLNLRLAPADLRRRSACALTSPKLRRASQPSCGALTAVPTPARCSVDPPPRYSILLAPTAPPPPPPPSGEASRLTRIARGRSPPTPPPPSPVFLQLCSVVHMSVSFEKKVCGWLQGVPQPTSMFDSPMLVYNVRNHAYLFNLSPSLHEFCSTHLAHTPALHDFVPLLYQPIPKSGVPFLDETEVNMAKANIAK